MKIFRVYSFDFTPEELCGETAFLRALIYYHLMICSVISVLSLWYRARYVVQRINHVIIKVNRAVFD